MSSGQRPYEIRVRISPKFMSGTLDSGVIGDRIDVYEDRVSGVEGWAQYRYGEDSRGQSRELFMRAVTHVEISAFVIDPAAFVDDIEYHFERYVAALRDPKNADLRDNFTRTWERKHAGGPLHVPLGFPPGFGPSSSLGLG